MTDDRIKEILDQVTSGWLLDEDEDHAHPHAIRHLVAAVEAAERERWQARIYDAFIEGFAAPETYNDKLLNDSDTEWAKVKDSLLKP